jgi:hypothetical protein
MNTFKKFIIVTILATIMAALVPSAYSVRATGWLTGYSYRKAVTITAQSGASTNYQVKLLIGKTSGATGENFDLAGHCLDTMLDMRFTASDETTALDYYIESVTASGTSYLATVWVEVAADLSSTNQDIYVYYGKSDATDGSNGDNTFPFFDNFPGSSIDGDKWTTLVGTPTVESGYVKLQSNERIKGNTVVGTGYAIRTKVDPVTESTNNENFWGWHGETYSNAVGVFSTYTNVGGRTYTYNSYYETINWARNLNSQIDEVRRNASTNVVFVENGVEKNTHSTRVPIENSSATLSADTNCELWADWILIRKFVATEPYFNTTSAEENAPTSRRRFL